METLAALDPLLKILEILAILGGAALAILKMNATSAVTQQTLQVQNGIIMELKTDLKQSMATIASVLSQVAVSNSRLDRVEADIREMQHGKTFVVDPPPLRSK